MIDDLLSVAWSLVGTEHAPSQASLKRAVSTAYYALFHALAQSNADVLVGSSTADQNWVRCYRAMDHVNAKKVLSGLVMNDKAHPLLAFAEAFTELQERRHEADYDPASHLSETRTAALVSQSSDAIRRLRSVPADLRRDLATRILFKGRT